MSLEAPGEASHPGPGGVAGAGFAGNPVSEGVPVAPAADGHSDDASPAGCEAAPGLPSANPDAAEGSPPRAGSPRAAFLARGGGVLAAVAISAVIVVFRRQLLALAGFGYAGLFVVGLVGSATIVLPMPGLVLAFATGASLSPILSGLAYGSGAALGELTGYLAGFGGSGVIENRAGYNRIHAWMKQWGAWAIFVLSIIPNPAFDIVGIAAGALRVPVWQFLAAAWAGNVIKATLVALAGAGAMGVIGPLIRDLLAR